MSSAFYAAAFIQIHLRLDFIKETNTMNPDQEQSDLGPYCLQYVLSKNISRRHEQTAKLTWSNKDYGGDNES